MAAVEILRAARARIADARNWTTGFQARNANGLEVRPDDPSAACWCAVGALAAVGGDPIGAERSELARQSGILFYRAGVVSVNDCLGHGAVLQVYDAAIAAAEAEGR